ncbi:hypothetical protein ACFZAV_21955 [Streptomyces sp. NPDC008343]|uniref:hypothetical protein n=1 Tax=Streptomyces sp. NPDC008343 TaxID=3364828 RepID=UPI0036EB155E
MDAKRIAFNNSIFAHAALTNLRLRESEYSGAPPIAVDKEQPLRGLEFVDCHVKADTLAISADSGIKTFSYYLDEDYAEACPDNFACWSPER